MFFLTLFGLLALIAYTYYTRQLVIDAENTSTQQTIDLKTSFAKTDEAIAATNRLAEEAARATAESHRLADAAAQSAAESRQLSREATRANAISHQALIGVQRAFMFPKGVDLEKVTNALATGDITGTRPVGWLARVKWENSGNTPTKNLNVDWGCLYSFETVNDPWGFVPKKDDKTKVLLKGQTRLVFGPKQTEYAGACALAPLLILIHQLGAYNYYIFGTATYSDVLDSKLIHRTEFCYAVQITGNIETGWQDSPGIQPLTSEAYPCQKHNCADDECKAEGL